MHRTERGSRLGGQGLIVVAAVALLVALAPPAQAVKPPRLYAKKSAKERVIGRTVKRLARRHAPRRAATATPAGAPQVAGTPRGTPVCSGETRPVTETGVAAFATTLRCVVERERGARGLPVPEDAAQLDAAALGHTTDMLVRGYFGHVSPDGGDMTARIVASGYGTESGTEWSAGEDVGVAGGTLATPAAMLQTWLDSPAHREVLLHPAYDDLGLGVLAGTPGAPAAPGVTVTMLLGTR